MFSAPKATWLLDAHDPDRSRSRRGELCLGTVDSWLLSRLGGEHVIEVGNASRTQLLDVRTCRWHPELLELFGVPESVLPTRRLVDGPVPGDPRAPAPSGRDPRARGDGRLARRAVRARRLAPRPGEGHVRHGVVDHEPRPPARAGLRGAVRDDRVGRRRAAARRRGQHPRQRRDAHVAGRRARAPTPEALAHAAAPSSDGVHLVPAFGGLGAPWWDDEAVGLFSGLTFGTGAPQLARAALESIAFQVEDVVAAVHREVAPVQTLLADGGPTANRVLMQLQADTSGRRVLGRPRARALRARRRPSRRRRRRLLGLAARSRRSTGRRGLRARGGRAVAAPARSRTGTRPSRARGRARRARSFGRTTA